MAITIAVDPLMRVEIDPLTAVVTLVMSAGLIAVAWWQLRAMHRTSQASLLEKLNTRWSSPQIKEARQALFSIITEASRAHDGKPDEEKRSEVKAQCARKLSSMRADNAVSYEQILDLWAFFETIGLSTKRNYIRKEDIIEIYAAPIIAAWEASESHIRDYREKIGAREDKGRKLLEHFNWLAGEARNYLARHQSGTY